jgi:CBS domain-containing protein
MLDIRDVMTKQAICISKETPILEAIELMAENDITGVPVVEDDMTLMGVLSDQDVLRLFHNYEDEIDATVNDFMTQPAIHFEQNELLSDVCHCLRENAIRRIPVTSNGKVVGVISRSDILKCILRFSRESTSAAESESK